MDANSTAVEEAQIEGGTAVVQDIARKHTTQVRSSVTEPIVRSLLGGGGRKYKGRVEKKKVVHSSEDVIEHSSNKVSICHLVSTAVLCPCSTPTYSRPATAHQVSASATAEEVIVGGSSSVGASGVSSITIVTPRRRRLIRGTGSSLPIRNIPVPRDLARTPASR